MIVVFIATGVVAAIYFSMAIRDVFRSVPRCNEDMVWY
jgi:uncharacterized protein YneF (UPF0154 family)